jgi:hypothetical protein
VEPYSDGQLALAAYKLDPQQRGYLPVALDVLSLRGTRITAITEFRTPEIFLRFGLPAELPRSPPASSQRTSGQIRSAASR